MKRNTTHIRFIALIITLCMILCFTACKDTDEKKAELPNVKEYTEANNIIMMIGDGLGEMHLKMTADKLNKELYITQIKDMAMCTTFSFSGLTDSGASATALATGFKTYNGMIGLPDDGKTDLTTLCDLAAAKGKSIGVLTTKSVADATPAAFTAHTTSRDTGVSEIVMEQIKNPIDILAGAGKGDYDKFAPGDDTTTYITDFAEYEAFQGGTKLIATFEDSKMPSLADMAGKALEILDRNENGFFLMMEGALIDTYSHLNRPDDIIKQVDDFDKTVGIVMDYMSNNPDTLLVITSDHETGGIEYNEETKEYYFTSDNHTNRDVAVRVLGYGSEFFAGQTMDNTDLSKWIAGVLGTKEFGQDAEYMDRRDPSKFKTDMILGLEQIDESLEVIFVDSTNPMIVSQFGEKSDEAVFGGSYHFTGGDKKTVKYTFQGTVLGVIMISGAADIYVDDVLLQHVVVKSKLGKPQLVYFTTSLEKGDHTVTLSSDTTSDPNYKYTLFDGLVIENVMFRGE